MRSLLAVAILAGISLSAAARQPKQSTGKSSNATALPKSMPAIKGPGAIPPSSTSRDLAKVERESARGTGSAHAAKKAPKPVALKPDKANKNPPMNFGGKGGSAGGGATSTKQVSPYKGRLKQKGASGHY